MKKYIKLILLLFVSLTGYSQEVILDCCSSTNDIIVNCPDVEVDLSVSQSFVSIEPFDQNYNNKRLKWELYKDGNNIDNKITGADQLFNGFNVHGIGSYKAKVKQQVFFLFFWVTNSKKESNVLSVNLGSNPIENNSCIHYNSSNQSNVSSRFIKIDNNTSYFILNKVNKSTILKINKTGGTGQNFLAIEPHNGHYISVQGYNYLIGQQQFNTQITDILVADNKTILSFSNGKMLKVTGSGGSGQNMFAVNETSDGFETVPGYDYRIGDAKFNGVVTEMAFINNQLILGFNNGKMLKVNGTGGNGHNMFAINETSGGFETVPGYDYRIGDAKFNGVVTEMAFINNQLLLGFNNGKMLKVNGTGGSGHNMFAITETLDGFETVTGYDYRIGDAKFNGAVTEMAFINNQLILCFNNHPILGFRNGKILKVNGTGGSGHNMFAITETLDGFETVTGYDYRIGDAKFNGAVTEMAFINNQLILSFSNRKMLKVNGTGGSGHNMFAVNETSDGFETVPGYDYRIGDAKFNGVVTEMAFINNQLLFGFNNGKMLKVNGTGGSGHNMFALIECSQYFNNLPNYNYFIGSQFFKY